MTNTASVNPTLELLQARFPALLRDIAAYVGTNPQSRVWKTTQPPAKLVSCGSTHYLINDHEASSVLRNVQQGQGRLIHVFTEISRFLQFVSQDGADQCVRSDRYLPILLIPLEQAMHTQQTLSQIIPPEWPWFLLEPAYFGDTEAVNRGTAFGKQLLGLAGVLTRNLGDALARKYPAPPNVSQILTDRQRPLKVLTVAFKGSSYQRYCARDMVDGLSGLGVHAEACISAGGPAHGWEILSAIERLQPDVLLLNGRARNGFVGIPPNLPVLTWDQDYMLSGDATYAQIRQPHDRLMVMVREWLEHSREHGLNETNVRYVNLGTNPTLYHPSTSQSKPEFDVLFVGNIYPFELYRKMIGFDNLPEMAQRLMLEARERLNNWISTRVEGEEFVIPDCSRLLHECLGDLDIPPMDAKSWQFYVHYFRYRVAHLLVRERYIEALGEFNLGLFGRGWDRFPQLAAKARPEIENGPALRDAIHRSAINLHLHTWTVHHPRLYDTAAAGGFLLVGRVPEQVKLETVFSPGHELECFGSIAELKRKVRHYLAHPDERQAMARNAADRASTEHDMKFRMQQAVEFLAAA